MKREAIWLREQEVLAQAELSRVVRDLARSAPLAAARVVRERPGTSMALAAAAGFAAVRFSNTCLRDGGLRGWIVPAVSGLRAVASATTFLRSQAFLG